MQLILPLHPRKVQVQYIVKWLDGGQDGGNSERQESPGAEQASTAPLELTSVLLDSQ